MNKKYQRYIDYIANDIKPPYFHNMVEMYGVTESEFVLIMTKVFNQYVFNVLKYVLEARSAFPIHTIY